jgi:hypothetical protein
VKTTIIVLSAAALITAAPAVLAQGIPGKTTGLQHHVSKNHHPGASGHAQPRVMQAKGSKRGSGAFGYAPGQSGGLDVNLEASRQAGGGGGGGSGM